MSQLKSDVTAMKAVWFVNVNVKILTIYEMWDYPSKAVSVVLEFPMKLKWAKLNLTLGRICFFKRILSVFPTMKGESGDIGPHGPPGREGLKVSLCISAIFHISFLKE